MGAELGNETYVDVLESSALCRMGEVYGKGRKVRCWLGEQLLFFWGDFSCCINP